MRRRDALGSGGRGHDDARVWLQASYVAMLKLLGCRAADDIHSREDTDADDGTHPNDGSGTVPNSASADSRAGRTGSGGGRNAPNSAGGASPSSVGQNDSAGRSDP